VIDLQANKGTLVDKSTVLEERFRWTYKLGSKAMIIGTIRKGDARRCKTTYILWGELCEQYW
jgi:hypothetical protein